MSLKENKTSPPSLRNSEELRVQYAPLGDPERPKCNPGVLPATFRYVKVGPNHRSKYASKVCPGVRTEEAGDVLKQEIPRSAPTKDADCIVEKPRSSCRSVIVLQPLSLSSYGQVLTREPAHHQIRTQPLYMFLCDLRDVPKVRDIRVVVLQDRARERFDLRESDALPAQRRPRHAGGFDPAKE